MVTFILIDRKITEHFSGNRYLLNSNKISLRAELYRSYSVLYANCQRIIYGAAYFTYCMYLKCTVCARCELPEMFLAKPLSPGLLACDATCANVVLCTISCFSMTHHSTFFRLHERGWIYFVHCSCLRLVILNTSQYCGRKEFKECVFLQTPMLFAKLCSIID